MARFTSTLTAVQCAPNPVVLLSREEVGQVHVNLTAVQCAPNPVVLLSREEVGQVHVNLNGCPMCSKSSSIIIQRRSWPGSRQPYGCPMCSKSSSIIIERRSWPGSRQPYGCPMCYIKCDCHDIRFLEQTFSQGTFHCLSPSTTSTACGGYGGHNIYHSCYGMWCTNWLRRSGTLHLELI